MFRRVASVFVLLFSLVFLSASYMEGFKTLQIGKNVTLQVPEKSPDFVNFSGGIIGSKKFPNGNAIAIAEVANAESTVFCLLVLVKLGDKVYIVAEQASYLQDRANPKSECMEDIQFVKTGKPSGKLMRVEKLTDYDKIAKWIEGTEA